MLAMIVVGGRDGLFRAMLFTPVRSRVRDENCGKRERQTGRERDGLDLIKARVS